jgi:hypothetical protein
MASTIFRRSDATPPAPRVRSTSGWILDHWASRTGSNGDSASAGIVWIDSVMLRVVTTSAWRTILSARWA